MKKKLFGVFEISLLMPDGINKFNNNKKEFLISIIIFFLCVLIMLPATKYYYTGSAELTGINLIIARFAYILRFCIGLITTVIVSLIICKIFKKKERFFHLMTVLNWSFIIPTILNLALFYTIATSSFSYDSLYPHFIIVIMYFGVITTFIVKNILQMPWELSVFFVIGYFAINETVQTIWHLIFFTIYMNT